MNRYRYLMLFLSFCIFSERSHAKVIPEVQKFVEEQIAAAGQVVVEHEDDFAVGQSRFRFENFGINVRGIVGFDVPGILDIIFFPDIGMYFEREPDKEQSFRPSPNQRLIP